MSELAKLSVDDLKALIRDTVSKQLADSMTVQVDEAKAQADAAARSGNPLEAFTRLAQQAGGFGDYQRAVVDKRTGRIIRDPHAGKGLDYVRAIKCMAIGVKETRDPTLVASTWAKAGYKQYEGTADLIRFLQEQGQRALSEGSWASGGILVPPQVGEFIELLYAVTIAYQLGARDLEFNRTLEMGRLNAGVTTYYVGELSNITPSTPAFGAVRLTARKLAALAQIPNELLRNPSVTADVILRDDMLRAIALRRDLSFFRGVGTENVPKGIANWMKSANKINSAGTTTANKVADLITLIRLVDESNVGLDMAAAGYAMAPRSKWALASSLDGQAQFVFAQMLSQGQLFGFPLRATTQIPTNLGGGTNESEVYFAAFNDCLLARDISTPLMVEVFPNGAVYDGSNVVSGISNDSSVMRAMEAHDVAMRHDNTASMMQQVTWT